MIPPPGCVLALDGASGACAAALVDDCVLAEAVRTTERNHAAILPGLVAQVMGAMPPPALVAVTVGPGSFTGLRGALALAHGLADGWGCGLVGVTVPEAMLHGLAAAADPDAKAWVVLQGRAGHVYLADGAGTRSVAIDAMPQPPEGTVLTGNAAAVVATALGGWPVQPCDRAPLASIAAIGRARAAGLLPPCPPQPLYVDAPAVRAPA